MATTEEEIIAKVSGGGNIPTHPEDQYAATCIDIVDVGMVEMEWKGQKRSKHRVYLRFFCGEWFTDEGNEERPLWVDKWLTLSLNEKGAMRPFLEQWRGKKFSEEELRGFNVAKLLGVPAFIQVAHNVTPEKVYANIATIMKLPKGMAPPGSPVGYVRVKDRPPKDGSENGAGAPVDDDDDTMPF